MSELDPSHELLVLPLEVQSERRQALLDEFEQQPNDDHIWQTAYDWAKTEGDHPEQAGIAANIPTEELIAMADNVRQTPQAERYSLMTQRASNGKYWFDVIEGFSSAQVREVLRDTIKSWNNSGDNPTHFRNALDVGSGIGNSLTILEGSADKVVGLERDPSLLNIAKERAGSDTRLVQGSVDALPFEDSSFDLVTSQGLKAALDKDSAENFLRELARIMTPNGIYIVGYYFHDEQGNPHPYLANITKTSKAMLSDMIGDCVSGSLTRTSKLSEEEENKLISDLGLNKEYYDVLDGDGISHTLITIITKENQDLYDPATLEIISVLDDLGENHGFDAETLDEIKALSFEEGYEVAYGYLTQAGLDADEILTRFTEPEVQESKIEPK